MKPLMVRSRQLAFLCWVLVCLAGISFTGAEPAGTTYTVEIKQMRFQPAQLQVKKGDVLVFLNKDLVTHDVTEASGKSWKSPPLAPRASWRLVVKGSANYFCSFHPVMKGRITVEGGLAGK